MEFYEDDDDRGPLTPATRIQGRADTLRGGTRATPVDKISSWVDHRKYGTGSVPHRTDGVTLPRPIRIPGGPILLRARSEEQHRRIVRNGFHILDASGNLFTEASCVNFIHHKVQARTDFHLQDCSVEAGKIEKIGWQGKHNRPS